MTTQRFLPAVQAIGRTIVCNRSDLLHHGIRICNSNHGSQGNYPSPNGNLNFFPNSEERLRFSHHLLHKGKGSYLKIVSKSFSTGVQLFCREFTDGENELAHNVLRSLPAYKNTTVDTNTNMITQYFTRTWSSICQEKPWASFATDELIDIFTYISKEMALNYLTLESQHYHNICTSLMERIPLLNDDQLQTVLTSLSLWSPSQSDNNSHVFDLLWKSLDESCCKRIKRWDFSKIFLIADHWYALRISKLSIFCRNLIDYFGIHLLKLTPTQLVQYLFYVNLNRGFGIIKKGQLELKIKDSLRHLSIEELGIVAMALFKANTNVQNIDLLNLIIDITINSLDFISDHSLGSILKLLKISLPSNAHSTCYNVLENLNPYLDKFNNFALLQAALLGNNLLVFHSGVMSKVGTRFGDEITSLRLKDIERFTYTLMLYKFIPPDHPIIGKIINELRKPERIVEINHFPKCFVSCINYLVALGAFPHDLISAALQPSMIQLLKRYSWDYIGREINELNWNVKIELPNYIGYSLHPQESEALTKEFVGKIPHKDSSGLIHQERLLLDIQTKISAMLGTDDCAFPVIILPHFSNPDLLFCTTSTGEPVKLPSEFQRLPAHVVKPTKAFSHLGLLWNAIIIGGRNSFIRDTHELRGNLEVKRRQLSKLGYKVSVVAHQHYSKVSTKYKLQYLERVLRENSSLDLSGRKEMALDYLKSTSRTDKTHAVAAGVS